MCFFHSNETLNCIVVLLVQHIGVPGSGRGSTTLNLKMSQSGRGSFSLSDLKRFTVDIACNKHYQIILSPHVTNTNASILLVVKTDAKVFVRDFFRDSREERNISLLSVSFHNQTTHNVVEVNKANDVGLEYVVENLGVVSLFGRMVGKTPRFPLYIGMLPTFYDSVRCELCERKSTVCGFCNSETVVNTERRQHGGSSEAADYKILNISVTTYTNDCLYWDDDIEVWTYEGCKVRQDNTATSEYIVKRLLHFYGSRKFCLRHLQLT